MTGAVESGTTDIKAVFDAMDKNGDGILTKREFRAGLEELNLIRDITYVPPTPHHSLCLAWG